MGKREQFVRVLLLSAKGMGWEPDGGHLEGMLDAAEKWVRIQDRRAESRDTEAWLSILDTAACEAPRGGDGDRSRADRLVP